MSGTIALVSELASRAWLRKHPFIEFFFKLEGVPSEFPRFFANDRVDFSVVIDGLDRTLDFVIVLARTVSSVNESVPREIT